MHFEMHRPPQAEPELATACLLAKRLLPPIIDIIQCYAYPTFGAICEELHKILYLAVEDDNDS